MCEPTYQVVMENILHRRSVRTYDMEPIDDAVLAQIIEAGRQSPSAANRQPWRFVIVRSPEQKKALAQACNGQMWLADAGALIVGLGLPSVSERWYRVDVSIALQTMVLAAASFGLGSCWIGAFDERNVKTVIDAPAEANVVAVVPIGVPKGEWPKPRPRKEVAEVFFGERYGQAIELKQ